MADKAAKEATVWRKVKTRNGKSVEIHTNHTSTSSNLLFLRAAVKAFLAENLYAEREDDWHREARSRTLYKIVPKPSRKMLYLHDKLLKRISSLMVQMRRCKIGLKKFLYEWNLPSTEDTECTFREREESVRQILTKCSHFGVMKRTIWADEVRKANCNWIDVRIILTTPAYLKKAEVLMQKTGLFGQFQGQKWGGTTKETLASR